MNAVQPLVLCGPSGSGKSTLLKRLMEEYSDVFSFSISHTTRKARQGEIHGTHYYFVERSTMEKKIQDGEFIESAEFSGNLYGTSHKAVEDCLSVGKICVLDIDVQGVKLVKKTQLNPLFVFIKPPSIESLEERLKGRGTETKESLDRRLNAAREEIAYGDAANNFDLVVVNDDVDKAYGKLKEFLVPHISHVLKCRKI